MNRRFSLDAAFHLEQIQPFLIDKSAHLNYDPNDTYICITILCNGAKMAHISLFDVPEKFYQFLFTLQNTCPLLTFQLSLDGGRALREIFCKFELTESLVKTYNLTRLPFSDSQYFALSNDCTFWQKEMVLEAFVSGDWMCLGHDFYICTPKEFESSTYRVKNEINKCGFSLEFPTKDPGVMRLHWFHQTFDTELHDNRFRYICYDFSKETINVSGLGKSFKKIQGEDEYSPSSLSSYCLRVFWKRRMHPLYHPLTHQFRELIGFVNHKCTCLHIYQCMW